MLAYFKINYREERNAVKEKEEVRVSDKGKFENEIKYTERIELVSNWNIFKYKKNNDTLKPYASHFKKKTGKLNKFKI